MSVVQIYQMYQVIDLTTSSGAELMNYPVNRTDFTLTRFVDNEVQFWIKNIDRRPVVLDNTTLTLHMSDPKTGRNLLSRDLVLLSESPTGDKTVKGLVQLFVSGDETGALPEGSLRYGVVMTRRDGVQTMLYTDRERKGVGTIRVVNGPSPAPIEPMLLSVSDFITRQGRLYSSPLPGAAMVHNLSGQHSAVFDLVAFTGRITVQGSLELQPSSTDSQWFDVVAQSYTGQTGKVHLPFEGNLMNVRFVIETMAGSIDLIQFRN